MKLQILVLFCLSVSKLQTTATIRQIHMVFRHGERSPSEIYPTNPNKEALWPLGLGHLTNAGKLQMYRLGQRIRKKYADFLPDYYYPKYVKVFSSYSDRCLMSAQLFTSGLFVPKNEQIWNSELIWQPIPMSYKPRDQDNMLAAKQYCTKYERLYQELFNTTKYKKILEDNADMFEYLTNHSGTRIDTIRKVEELYNSLEIEQLNGLNLPDWSEKFFPSRMRSIAALSLASFTETDYMKRMKGGTLVKKVIEDMKRSLINTDEPTLWIYSAHDLTLVNILRTLGLTEELKPGFASNIIFELYNSSNQIKVFYSDCGWCEEKEFNIQNCVNPCRLKSFETYLSPVLPENWSTECSE